MENPHYMILRLPDSYRPIIICADPLETNAPATGILQLHHSVQGRQVAQIIVNRCVRSCITRGQG